MEEDEDESPLLRTQSSAPTKYMIEGEKMIQEMQSAREEHMMKNRKSEGVNASLIIDKNYNVKASDLIMMTVTEKLDYLEKR